jgi:hypothetical protein
LGKILPEKTPWMLLVLINIQGEVHKLEIHKLEIQKLALLIKGMNLIEAISSHPHLKGGRAEPSLQDLPPG